VYPIGHSLRPQHSREYAKTQKVNHYTLCSELDQCLGGLLDDLSKTKDKNGRTLLDKTLIVCMGEFGRTPGELTPNWARSSSLCQRHAVCRGRRQGRPDHRSDRRYRREGHNAGWHAKRSVYPEDVVTTIYSALGIDWTKEIQNTPSGRTFYYVDGASTSGIIAPDEIGELFV